MDKTFKELVKLDMSGRMPAALDLAADFAGLHYINTEKRIAKRTFPDSGRACESGDSITYYIPKITFGKSILGRRNEHFVARFGINRTKPLAVTGIKIALSKDNYGLDVVKPADKKHLIEQSKVRSGISYRERKEHDRQVCDRRPCDKACPLLDIVYYILNIRIARRHYCNTVTDGRLYAFEPERSSGRALRACQIIILNETNGVDTAYTLRYNSSKSLIL